MNSAEAERQINQMIAFIRNEAKEKAEEIRVKTESACMSEKLNLQAEASVAIKEEYERKRKDWLIQKKIARSKQVNSNRVSVMKDRNDKVSALKTETILKLAEVARSDKYPELIKFLMAEALMSIMEKNVIVRCREEDQGIVEDQMDGAVALFKDTICKASGVTPELTLTLDTNDFLPPAPVAGKEGKSCCGGIVLSAKGGKIMCKNTLDSRLDLAYDDLKPQIRGMIFGVRAKTHS